MNHEQQTFFRCTGKNNIEEKNNVGKKKILKIQVYQKYKLRTGSGEYC